MRSKLAIWATVCIGLAASTAAFADSIEQTKNRILAGILVKLPGYVNFSVPSQQSLCVMQDREFFVSLQRTSKSPSQFKFISAPLQQELSACAFVYVKDRKIARAMLIQKAQSSFLLISDYPRFIDEGGPLALVENDGRMEIHLNLTAAKIHNAAFSPDLIEISKRVIQ